eukprot:6182691-Pleurochrysis_carterae.AAC.2
MKALIRSTEKRQRRAWTRFLNCPSNCPTCPLARSTVSFSPVTARYTNGSLLRSFRGCGRGFVVGKNKAQFDVEVDADALHFEHCVRREEESAEAGHVECIAQLERCFHVGAMAVTIPNIICGNAQNDEADEFDGQGEAVGNLDAHVRVALRLAYAAGGKEAAIAACRSACRAAVNEYNSRAAADSAGRSRRAGRR